MAAPRLLIQLQREYIVSKKLFSLKALGLAALLCASAAANADITVYTSEAAFNAAVANRGVDTFDDLPLGSLSDTLDRTAGSYSYTASAANGLWGAGVPGDTWLSTNLRTDSVVFSNFSGHVSAFGGNFFGTDIGGAYVPGGDLVLTATDGFTLTYSLNGTTQSSFLGFVSDGDLGSVTLTSNGNSALWPTANNVVLAVPEPTTYGMLLAGLGFMAVMARRRRS
jgi:hypothetical protein